MNYNIDDIIKFKNGEYLVLDVIKNEGNITKKTRPVPIFPKFGIIYLKNQSIFSNGFTI